jgi:hypothetical protein
LKRERWRKERKDRQSLREKAIEKAMENRTDFEAILENSGFDPELK